MKCVKCNEEIESSATFCPNCGTKVINEEIKKISLKCTNCNGTLSIDSDKSVLVCPYCGAKELIQDSDAVTIEKIRTSANKEIEMEKIKRADRWQAIEEERKREQEEINQAEKFKKGLFSKFLILAFFISIVWLIFAFSQLRIYSGIFATIQAVIFAVSWLMGMQIIKERKRYLHLFVGIIGVILLIPTLIMFSVEYIADTDWNIIFLGDVIPEPSSKKLDIQENTKSSLWVDVKNISQEEYYSYIIECKKLGYNKEIDDSSRGFVAYTETGYGIELSYYSSLEEMSIEVTAPSELTELNWEKHSISKVLPAPSSDSGLIVVENSEETELIVGKISSEEYQSYCFQCKEKGFNIDEKNEDYTYIAYNKDGYSLNISYTLGNKEMCINLTNPMEFTKIAWPKVGVGTLAPVLKSLSGKVECDNNWSYSVYIENMPRTEYEDYIQKCIDAGFDKDILKYDDRFSAYCSDDESIDVYYLGNNIVNIYISGSMDKDY